jgi:PHD/YefM family antitoxin component YafN of YafNO toxin-antitoxin module
MLATTFDLDADISVTELRNEEALTQRLHDHDALRLRRRNEVLGVVVSAEKWRRITQALEAYEATIEEHEEEAVRSLIAARASSAKFSSVDDAVWGDVMTRYERLLRE